MSSKKHYPEVASIPDFPAMEKAVLAQWEKEDTFRKSIEQRQAKVSGVRCQVSEKNPETRNLKPETENNEWVFYDGPPFANGLPHYGHLLTSAVKDIFARYHTMKGERVERRFGWDCHGLPAEMEAEKELNVSGRKAIEEFGIAKFNDHCRTSVMKYTDIWQDYVNRAARWVDFEHDYKTMDRDYMESVLWAFKQLHEKGLLYESYRVMPYSWSAQTPLSNFETRMDDAYRERVDKAITVAFELEEVPGFARDEFPNAKQCYLLAWTTTPWTLPSNLALAVNKNITYTLHVAGDKLYIMSEKSWPAYDETLQLDIIRECKELKSKLKSLADIKSSKELSEKTSTGSIVMTGDELFGLSYKPLFPYFKDQPNAFKILDGSDFIEEGEGTGVVHLAPGFGEDDQRVCAENDIGIVCPVDEAGCYTEEIFDLPRTIVLPDDVIFETARLYARPFKEEDEPLLYDLYHSEGVKEVYPNIQTHECVTQNLQSYIDHQEKFGFSKWAIFSKETGEFVGRGGVNQLDFFFNDGDVSIERGMTLYKKYWGKGYGTELAFGITDYIFSNHKIDEVVTCISVTNERSCDLQEKLGMEYMETVEQEYMGASFTRKKYRMTKQRFYDEQVPEYQKKQKRKEEISHVPPLSLKGLNVIKQVEGKCEDEPYKPEQLEKYGLANLRIINWLKLQGQLIKQEDYAHNYPHCWRTDEPIIYKAVSSWYVEVTKFKDRMVALNQNINWIPEHIKGGQFGKWLENARDWSISRNRFWGTPIPVWQRVQNSESGIQNPEIKVFGSIVELEEFFGVEVKDLHRPFIDELKTAKDGSEWRRVTDVFDCWFESGAMPFAQVHYPFENKDWFDSHFPADFIVEYVGQTRGWFYTLMVLGTALFDKEPFKNCICHGIILDAEGKKLSKRLRNYPDPNEMFDTYGADAMRWRMVKEPVMHGGNLLISKDGSDIRDVVRLSIKPIWNAYNFFTLYANADGVKAKLVPGVRCQVSGKENADTRNLKPETLHVMDRYILAKLKQAVGVIEEALDTFHTPEACSAVDDFFEVLNNWYIRRNRDRFWRSVQVPGAGCQVSGKENADTRNPKPETSDPDKQAAYDTLYTVLVTMARAAAPLLPLTLEEIYRGLTGEKSVHLQDFPDVSAIADEAELASDMDRVRDACNSALAVRNAENIRIRQPLATLTLFGEGVGRLAPYAELIQDELNVKEVAFSEDLAEVASRTVQINFPVCGKRLGEKMKEIATAAKQGQWKDLGDGTVEVAGEVLQEEEFDIKLEPKEGVTGAQGLSTNDALVVLDLEITEELKKEGIARDLVRLIQEARKSADLHISDRIELAVEAENGIREAVEANRDYITEQTLAVKLDLEGASARDHTFENILEDTSITIGFSKAA